MTPRQLAERLRKRARVMQIVAAALESDGAACPTWGQGEAWHRLRDLEAVGVELVTETAATKRGHRLKRGACPVAYRYFGAPIQRHAPLYVFGVQTTAKGDQ